jgi:hypothetical protein
LVQWSVPSLLPALSHYSGFRPARQARFLDYLTIHFYPLAEGGYRYDGPAGLQKNLAYLESVVRETALAGKPVVLGEFGWYGGGTPRFDGGRFPPATQAQQAEYCRRALEVSRPFVRGWLNWGLYDDPDATDCSELTGLLTADGAVKEWGRAFQSLADGGLRRAEKPRDRPALDWDGCLTNLIAGKHFRERYWSAFCEDH